PGPGKRLSPVAATSGQRPRASSYRPQHASPSDRAATTIPPSSYSAGKASRRCSGRAAFDHRSHGSTFRSSTSSASHTRRAASARYPASPSSAFPGSTPVSRRSFSASAKTRRTWPRQSPRTFPTRRSCSSRTSRDRPRRAGGRRPEAACSRPHATSLGTDFDDRAVKDDLARPLGQSARLLELVDLVVALDQHGLRAALPGQDRLVPERRVVLLARLGAEHRQLTGRRPTLDEGDLGKPLHLPDAVRVRYPHRP